MICSQQRDATVLPMSIICQPSSTSVILWNWYLPVFFSWSLAFHFLILLIFNLQMVDPGGIANWSVTHVDWSEGKWHPRSYRAADVTYELLKNITVCFYPSQRKTYFATCPFCVSYWSIWLYFLQSVNENFHITSDDKVSISIHPCPPNHILGRSLLLLCWRLVMII